VKLHVQIRGHGPDLVLLHGWALHGGLWGPWLEGIAAEARLHLVDLPGHGRSPWHDAIRDLPGLARALRPGVPEGAVVLGWSLGGMAALELARQEPGRLSALILIASTPKFVAGDGWEHGLPPAVLDEFARGLARDHHGTVQNFLALQTRGDEHGRETLRILRRDLESHGPPDPRALGAGLEILRRTDLRAALSGITQPALVISGDYDRLTPPGAGLALATALPEARYAAIRRAGHAPFLSHGPAVLREVRGFLARAVPGARVQRA
jgi:pimeloyl-[acyl-carrier protein] methyl ester esterase